MKIECPKCGTEMKILGPTKQRVCAKCGKMMFGTYPRFNLIFFDQMYDSKPLNGYLCVDCAKEMGIDPTQKERWFTK